MAFKNRAFTLVELLVVFAVIGILLSLALPAVQAVRASARRISCANNLQQIALGVVNFETTFQSFPAGNQTTFDGAIPAVSWLARVLPYIEQSSIWEVSIAEHRAGVLSYDHSAIHIPVEIFGCPSDGRSGTPQITHGGRVVGLTSYVGVSGIDRTELSGVLVPDRSIKVNQISDGLSQTLMIGERPPSPDNWYGFWYAGLGQDSTGITDMIMGIRETNLQVEYAEGCPAGPYKFTKGQFDEMCDTFHFWSPHPGGANFAFADGSVKYLPYDVEPLMGDLATRSGHEVITQSW